VPGLPLLSHSAHAVTVSGELIFVNGILPVDGDGKLVGDDILTQARKVFGTMWEILAAAGASFGDVAKLTIFLTDVSERDAIARLREEVFGDAHPASTLVEVSRLAVPGARIEVDCVAVAGR